MKTTLNLLIVLILSIHQCFGVACSGIEITSGRISFYNWSNGPYSLSGHYITVGEVLLSVAALNIVSGALMVQPGETVTFSGISYKASAVDPNSIALWSSNDTTTATGYMVEFAQWGAAGQPFEAKAVSSGLWAAGDFIPGEPDYVRDTYTFTQPISNEWSALDNITGIVDLKDNMQLDLDVTPNPFYDKINVTVSHKGSSEHSVQLYDQSGKLLDKINGIRETNTKLAENIELPAGIYFIRVSSTDGSSATRKVLKL